MDWLVEVEVQCPYCGEETSISIDTSQGAIDTIEDCSVCCRPMTLQVESRSGEVLSIVAMRA